MPIRYVTVPLPVTLRDPATKEAFKNEHDGDAVLTFGGFLQKLMHNPTWGENWRNTKAQEDIMSSWEECESSNGSVWLLGEEEWLILKNAAEFPKVEVIIPGSGTQIRSGYGYHPAVVRQLVPMISAIMDAPTTDPRTK